MKQGVIEIQFNWIIILIIGGLILTFFFVLVQNQRESTDVKISITSRRDIRTIFTGALATPGKTARINVPVTDIEFSCQGYAIGDLSPVRSGVIFAPGLIDGNIITATSARFAQPYTSEDILLLTSPNHRYIIVNSTPGFAAELNKSLPPEIIVENNVGAALFSKEVVYLDENNLQPALTDKNNYRVRFVFFNYDPRNLNPSALNQLENDDDEVTAIQIIPDPSCTDPFTCYGEIKYYVKTGSTFNFAETTETQSTTYYIGKSSILGAMLSDIDLYNCNMAELFDTFSLVSDIYLDRTSNLFDFYTTHGNHLCSAVLSAAKIPLENIRDNADITSGTFPTPLDSMHTNSRDIENLNNQVIKLSCAEIF